MSATDAEWDAAIARRSAARDHEQRSPAVAAGYYAEGAFDPEQTRAALAKLTAPVLILVAEFDLSPTPERAVEAASLFPSGEIALQPASAHMPSHRAIKNPPPSCSTAASGSSEAAASRPARRRAPRAAWGSGTRSRPAAAAVM